MRMLLFEHPFALTLMGSAIVGFLVLHDVKELGSIEQADVRRKMLSWFGILAPSSVYWPTWRILFAFFLKSGFDSSTYLYDEQHPSAPIQIQ